MFIWNTFVAFGIFSIAFAGPLNKRKPCSPDNMVDDQRDWGCDRLYEIDKDGHCMSGIKSPDKQGYCTGYCQMSLSKGYGQELPIGVFCQAGTICNWQEAKTVTTTQTWTVDANVGMGTGEKISKVLTGAFNGGASYSWSVSHGFTTGKSSGKTLANNQCGYWTFIPYTMTSCGTLTEVDTWQRFTSFTSGSETVCDTTKVLRDVANWCNTAFSYDSDGHLQGETVFVFLNCDGGGRLKNEEIPTTAKGGDADPKPTQPSIIFRDGVFTGQVSGKPGRKE